MHYQTCVKDAGPLYRDSSHCSSTLIVSTYTHCTYIHAYVCTFWCFDVMLRQPRSPLLYQLRPGNPHWRCQWPFLPQKGPVRLGSRVIGFVNEWKFTRLSHGDINQQGSIARARSFTYVCLYMLCIPLWEMHFIYTQYNPWIILPSDLTRG